MSIELDDLADRAEAAGFSTLAIGYRKDAQDIRESGGPEFFVPLKSISKKKAPTDFAAELGSKMNIIGGQLPDNVLLEDLRVRKGDIPYPNTPEEWISFSNSLTQGEKRALSGAIIGVQYNSKGVIKTVGDLRAQTSYGLYHNGMLGQSGAILMATGFAKNEDLAS